MHFSHCCVQLLPFRLLPMKNTRSCSTICCLSTETPKACECCIYCKFCVRCKCCIILLYFYCCVHTCARNCKCAQPFAFLGRTDTVDINTAILLHDGLKKLTCGTSTTTLEHARWRHHMYEFYNPYSCKKNIIRRTSCGATNNVHSRKNTHVCVSCCFCQIRHFLCNGISAGC